MEKKPQGGCGPECETSADPIPELATDGWIGRLLIFVKPDRGPLAEQIIADPPGSQE